VIILGADGDPRKWSVFTSWRPLPGSKLSKNMWKATQHNWEALSDSDFDLPGAQMGEAGAIKTALELIQSDLIWKVGRCKCGKFFFRKFSHQHFCSEKCRIANFRSTDEARAKRNEYARKLYHLHKTGKVK